MKAFSSLTNRIFFATGMLAVLSIAVAIAIVNVAVTRQAEQELRHGLDEAGVLVSQYWSLRFEHFANEARLIADLPKLKAAVDTNDPPTVKNIAKEYQEALKADFFIITRNGRLLARFGATEVSDEELMSMPGSRPRRSTARRRDSGRLREASCRSSPCRSESTGTLSGTCTSASAWIRRRRRGSRRSRTARSRLPHAATFRRRRCR